MKHETRQCNLPTKSTRNPQAKGHPHWYTGVFTNCFVQYMYVWSSHIAKYRSTEWGYQSFLWSAEQGKYVLPVPVRAWEFGFTKQVRRSRPATARLLSPPRLNLVHTHDLLSFLLFFLYHQPSPGQSRVCQVTQMRTDGVHCRKSTSTGP